MNVIEQIVSWIQGFLDTASPAATMGLKALGALAASAIAWLVIRRILTGVENRSRSIRLFQAHAEIFQVFRGLLFYGLLLLTGSYLIRLFDMELLTHPFHALLIMLLARPILQLLMIILTYMEKNIAQKTATKVDNIIFDLLNKLAGVIVYATASIIALDTLGVNVMPFIAGAGVAGIAIGFAAKDTLSNLIAGILLIIDRPFEVGDRIEVWSAPANSATWGDVIDIGLRATRIRTTDNIVIIIPNNEIMTRDIVNYTIIDRKIRVRINIGIAYDADIEKAKSAILEVVGGIPWIARSPAPKIVVVNFGESSVDLQARVWIDDARRRIDTISEVTDRVKRAFDAVGIEIPYPKRDVHIISGPPAAASLPDTEATD